MNEIKGIFYRDIKNDYIAHILKEIYMDNVYTQFIGDKKDLVIADVGGNQGLTTLYFSQFAKQVYTVEPSSQHIEVINKMIEFNKLTNVKVFHAAIANENKEMVLNHNANTTMFSLSEAVKDGSSEGEKVQAMTMETLLKDNKIDHVDFLKLDVEGSEMEIVGGKGFENVADRIYSGLVEYHTWSGANPSQLTTTLMDYGFKVFPVPSDASLFGFRRESK